MKDLTRWLRQYTAIMRVMGEYRLEDSLDHLRDQAASNGYKFFHDPGTGEYSLVEMTREDLVRYIEYKVVCEESRIQELKELKGVSA